MSATPAAENFRRKGRAAETLLSPAASVAEQVLPGAMLVL